MMNWYRRAARALCEYAQSIPSPQSNDESNSLLQCVIFGIALSIISQFLRGSWRAQSFHLVSKTSGLQKSIYNIVFDSTMTANLEERMDKIEDDTR